jgi:glycosyltransferase involved in cell wall biosynthesis
MRVAHVITRMIVGGAQENTLYNCLDLIREYGDDVLLITGPALGPEGDLLTQGRGEGLPVRYIESLRRNIHPWRDVTSYWELKRVLREYRPDVVHTHSAKGGWLGRIAATRLGVRAVVHTVHGAPFHSFQSPMARHLFRWCEWFAARNCHRLVSVADAMTDLMVKGRVAPSSKFTTIYSGMDVEPFLAADLRRDEYRRRLGVNEQTVVVGKIARLFHLKGHEYLIEAARDVIQKAPHVKFLLVGDGVLREKLEQQIARYGLTDHFLFVGLVPPEEIPHWIGAMDILVHTSLREGLARALPQALISGRPAVSFDIDGAREVVIADETGVLVEPCDVEGLALGLTRLANDPVARQRMGGEGRRRFTESFRHQTMTRRLKELYEELLAQNTPI